jgi:hypothetical protein
VNCIWISVSLIEGKEIERAVVAPRESLKMVTSFSNAQRPETRCNGIGCSRPGLRADARRQCLSQLQVHVTIESKLNPYIEMLNSDTVWPIFRAFGQLRERPETEDVAEALLHT